MAANLAEVYGTPTHAELKKIRRIAILYIDKLELEDYPHIPPIEAVVMAIRAGHAAAELDLDAMLAGEIDHICSDINAFQVHHDRRSGKFINGFWPHFSKYPQGGSHGKT